MFRFKQFSVDDTRSAMKVGTDGVLLGAWCDVNGGRMLDIGTGSGLIALMLAQRRSQAVIDAIDIDPGCVADATDNVMASPWSDRIEVRGCSLQEYSRRAELAGAYDRIVSNPPYFIDSFLPPEKQRRLARHTATLDFAELIEGADRLLGKNGLFSLILPPVEAERFIAVASGVGLGIKRRTDMLPRRGAKVKRVLLELARGKWNCGHTYIIQRGEGEDFTEEYRALTRDFYLKF